MQTLIRQRSVLPSRALASLAQLIQRSSESFIQSRWQAQGGIQNAARQQQGQPTAPGVFATLEAWQLCGVADDALSLRILTLPQAVELMGIVPQVAGCSDTTCLRLASKLRTLRQTQSNDVQSIDAAMSAVVNALLPSIGRLPWEGLASLLVATADFNTCQAVAAVRASAASRVVSFSESRGSFDAYEAHEIASCMASLGKKKGGTVVKQVNGLFVQRLIEALLIPSSGGDGRKYPATFRDPSVLLSTCSQLDENPPSVLDDYLKGLLDQAEQHNPRDIERCLKPLGLLADRFPARFDSYYASLVEKSLKSSSPVASEDTEVSLRQALRLTTLLGQLTRGRSNVPNRADCVKSSTRELLARSLSFVPEMSLRELLILCLIVARSRQLIPARVTDIVAARCEHFVSMPHAHLRSLVFLLYSLSSFIRPEAEAACSSFPRMVGLLLDRPQLTGPMLAQLIWATGHVYGSRGGGYPPPALVDMIFSRLNEQLRGPSDEIDKRLFVRLISGVSFISGVRYDEVRGLFQRGLDRFLNIDGSVSPLRRLSKRQWGELRDALVRLGCKDETLLAALLAKQQSPNSLTHTARARY